MRRDKKNLLSIITLYIQIYFLKYSWNCRQSLWVIGERAGPKIGISYDGSVFTGHPGIYF